MTTLNRYASNGTRYSFEQFAERFNAMRPRYLHAHPMPLGKDGRPSMLAPVRRQPYVVGRNASKRAARANGWKSLKQAKRAQHRGAELRKALEYA